MTWLAALVASLALATTLVLGLIGYGILRLFFKNRHKDDHLVVKFGRFNLGVGPGGQTEALHLIDPVVDKPDEVPKQLDPSNIPKQLDPATVIDGTPEAPKTQAT